MTRPWGPVPRARCAVMILATLAGQSACTESSTQEQVVKVYDPYDGPEPYPNKRPKLTPPDGSIALVSDYGADTITVIDLDAREVVGSASIGRSPIDLDGPHHVAADRARGIAYTVLAYPAPAILPGPHAAHGSSTRLGVVQRLALDDMRVLGEVRVDTNPGDIVASDDGSRVVVSHFDLQRALVPEATLEEKRANLAVIDPEQILESGSPEPIRIPVCVAPHGMVLSRPDGRTAYVACYGEDAIAVVDLMDLSADVVRVPVGAGAGAPGAPSYGPYAVSLSPSGKRIAVGNTESREVRFFSTEANTMDSVIVTTLGAAYFAAWSADETVLYVPVQAPDALVVADPATGIIQDTVLFDKETCERPHEAVLAPAGNVLYVVCEGDHVGPGRVLLMDPATREILKSLSVGAYPDRFLLLPAVPNAR